MPMSLMQRYDWSDVKTRLVYSLPEYSNIHDDNVSGLALLNRIIKDCMDSKIPDSSITIEYQVTDGCCIITDLLISLYLILTYFFL